MNTLIFQQQSRTSRLTGLKGQWKLGIPNLKNIDQWAYSTNTIWNTVISWHIIMKVNQTPWIQQEFLKTSQEMKLTKTQDILCLALK